MHALVVVAHSDQNSFTHQIAKKITEGIIEKNASNSYELADLSQENFDPRFSSQDLALFRNNAECPQDIIAEQQRVDRADALVLVFPVYWWSFPALLKGWIDRVFTNGWAYDQTADGKLLKKLKHLRVHIIGVGASDAATYRKHGYESAMKTQIDHGIFDYVGAPVGISEVLSLSDAGFPDIQLTSAQRIGHNIFD